MNNKPFDHKKRIILTPQEERIIVLMCEDLSLIEIAERLGIIKETVYTTLGHARKVNKIRTNFGLMARYIGNGYYNEIAGFANIFRRR